MEGRKSRDFCWRTISHNMQRLLAFPLTSQELYKTKRDVSKEGFGICISDLDIVVCYMHKCEDASANKKNVDKIGRWRESVGRVVGSSGSVG